VFLEETIKRLLLSNGEFARLDTGVIHPEEGVNVVHGLCSNISEFLDLGGGVLDLEKGKTTCKA
jgi:hypothetical protein